MARTARVQYNATGQGDIEMAVMRSRQLKEWIDGAVKERQEIAEKLDVAMQEHNATALVIDGVQVARIDEYDQAAISGKSDFVTTHPRLWKAFSKVTHIRKVVVG